MLFQQAAQIMSRKEHLTQQGRLLLCTLRASINRGLAIEGAIPADKLSVGIIDTLNPHWVAGFTSGDGSFIAKTSLHRGKPRARIGFNISQNVRDANLMNSLVKFFNCGNVYNNASHNMLVFEVYDFNDAYSIIMPFFKLYPVIGVKHQDFVDWCKIVEMMLNKEHLTESGMLKITTIKNGMNSKRGKQQ